MKYVVDLGDRRVTVTVEGGSVLVDGEPVAANLTPAGDSQTVSLLLDGASLMLRGNYDGGGRWTVHDGSRSREVRVLDERRAAIEEMSGAGANASVVATVKAPMPGMVVKVEVEEGDVVEAGAGVIIVEAMKMENELKAPARCRIGRVLVAPGEAVDKGQILIETEDPDTE